MSKIAKNNVTTFLATNNDSPLEIDLFEKCFNEKYQQQQQPLKVINHYSNFKGIRHQRNSNHRRNSYYLQDHHHHHHLHHLHHHLQHQKQQEQKQQQQQQQQQQIIKQQLQHSHHLISSNNKIVNKKEKSDGDSKIVTNDSTSSTIDLYFRYGDLLVCCGRLYEAFDVYAHIANQLGDIIPIERLKHLSSSLISSFAVNCNNCGSDSFISLTMANNFNNTNTNSMVQQAVNSNPSMLQRISGQNFNDFDMQHRHQQLQQQQQHQQYNLQQHQQQQQQQQHIQQLQKQKQHQQFTIDSLLCPFCEDVLMCPVTAPCGHTFCSQCCSSASQCIVCGVKFNLIGSNNIENIQTSDIIFGLKQDVLIKRLIDKWWPQELEARKLNEEAIQYLNMNSLDDALKYCNQSLEKSPNNYKSLLLRSEVLYRLNHYQSSLADADNALKNHPTSSKAHHRRALALIGLGRNEEALISQCLAASFDINSTCISSSTFKNEVCRLLQRFLIPSTKGLNSTTISSTLSSSSPYSVAMKKRRKHRKKLIQISQNPGTSDCDEANSSCGEDDNFVHENRRRYIRRSASLSTESSCIIPRSSMRLRTLLDRIQQEVQKMKRIEHKPNILHVNPNQVDISDFDCVLCCRTLWKPVVTPCGHTYCWVCLDRCMDYSSSCPLCMSPLVEQPLYRQSYRGGSSTPIPFSLGKKSVTKFLEIAMQRFIPDWYEKRRRQENESEPSVPVFICTTAFPNVPCPLFVYEPRYRLMVRRAIESGERQFGIVQPNTGKSRYSDIGTMLDIRDCVLLGDGCSILSTIGCRRFKILSRHEKDGYETAKVEYIYDEPISDDFIPIINEMNSAVLRKARKWFESLSSDIKEEILRSFGPMPALEDNWERMVDGPAWAWWIIAILPLNQQLKVNILATTSLEKRLRAIGKTLDYITGRIRKSSQQNCVVVQCEGLPSCQAIECCQQTTQSTTQSDEHHPDVNSQTEYML